MLKVITEALVIMMAAVLLGVTNVHALEFYALEPCRIVDTRAAGGGGPLQGGINQYIRKVTVAGKCGVPWNASAVAVNVTAIDPSNAGYLAIFPAGDPDPSTVPSTMNFSQYTNTANGAIVKLRAYAVEFWAGFGPGNQLDMALDVSGYFK
ncbi:hypothetical protein MK489_22050 [Myxococcota bacterium]|nr:hypothetical protein [Myxococcota bacterium]